MDCLWERLFKGERLENALLCVSGQQSGESVCLGVPTGGLLA